MLNPVVFHHGPSEMAMNSRDTMLHMWHIWIYPSFKHMEIVTTCLGTQMADVLGQITLK